MPVHDGRIVHLSIDTVRFPDGSVGELEMIRHSGASAVLPLLGSRDDADPEIVLIRQYRYASGGYMFEVPAGRPDRPGEDWEVCARRELEEETGSRPEWKAHAFGDLEENVRESIERIRGNPFIPRTEDVRGFVYEVETGRLREVS